MSSSPTGEASAERFVALYQPAGRDGGARIVVLNEAEDLLVARGSVDGPAVHVADWDAVLASLGFVRMSAWRRFQRSMQCAAERAS